MPQALQFNVWGFTTIDRFWYIMLASNLFLERGQNYEETICYSRCGDKTNQLKENKQTMGYLAWYQGLCYTVEICASIGQTLQCFMFKW